MGNVMKVKNAEMKKYIKQGGCTLPHRKILYLIPKNRIKDLMEYKKKK